MNNALGVGGIERVCDVDSKRQDRFHREGTAPDAVLERRPFQKFHCDEGVTILLARVVDGADVWMVQCRRSLRFALEANQGMRVASEVCGQEFEGDQTMQADVF